MSRLIFALALLDASTALRLPSSRTANTRQHTRRDALLSAFGAALLPLSPSPLFADDTSGAAIGAIPASGIIFKDIVRVDRIDDPKVKGVELYVSQFERPLVDRLAGDFFADPAQAAVTCVRVGPMELAENIDASELGEEVFSQSRNLLLKSVNVRRLYDRERGVIVYVSYSTRLNKSDDENKSRFKTTMCALKVEPTQANLRAPPPPAPPPAASPPPPPAPPPTEAEAPMKASRKALRLQGLRKSASYDD